LSIFAGVDMATRACKRAIEEWGGSIADVSHMVSVSCTVSSNPGYDHFVAQNLGLRPNVEKTLLAGVGCSGGMSALRLAANLVLSSAQQGKKAVVLVLACEVTSCLARAELERVASTGELHIGVSLFSDGAGALILTGEDDRPATNGSATNGTVNGTTIGHHSHTKGVYELNNWVNMNLPDTTEDLGFDASAFGWKVILSQRVPELTAKAMPELFRLLCEGAKKPLVPAECDWAMQCAT
jgi:type III polyketide synthase